MKFLSWIVFWYVVSNFRCIIVRKYFNWEKSKTAGRGYNNMNHEDNFFISALSFKQYQYYKYFNYKFRFKGVFHKFLISFPEVFHGVLVLNLSD